MRLLMIEKHTSLAASQLSDDRLSIVSADTADDALSMLRHGCYDLVLVSIASLGPDGLHFIRRFRTTRDDTPLVALTGNRADDRIRALSLGADDAIAQPVDLSELRARITAVVRRNNGYSQSAIRMGELSVCLETREVRFRDRPVHLTGKEYSTLELLMLRKGTVVTKEMFLNHLYSGMDEPEMKIIDVFISKLRRRLERAGLEDFIGTVWGRGYIIRDTNVRKQQPMAAVSDSHPAIWPRAAVEQLQDG